MTTTDAPTGQVYMGFTIETHDTTYRARGPQNAILDADTLPLIRRAIWRYWHRVGEPDTREAQKRVSALRESVQHVRERLSEPVCIMCGAFLSPAEYRQAQPICDYCLDAAD